MNTAPRVRPSRMSLPSKPMLALSLVVLVALLSFLMHLLDEQVTHGAVPLGSHPVGQISGVVRSAQAETRDQPMAASERFQAPAWPGGRRRLGERTADSRQRSGWSGPRAEPERAARAQLAGGYFTAS